MSTGQPVVNAILRQHGLTPANAAHFVETATRLNRQEAADEIGVNVETVFRYKNAFAAMAPDERAQVIAWAGQFVSEQTRE